MKEEIRKAEEQLEKLPRLELQVTVILMDLLDSLELRHIFSRQDDLQKQKATLEEAES